MKRLLKWIGMMLLAYITLFGGYFYYGLHSAPSRMSELCGQINAGMSWADLMRFASANDFLMPHKQFENGVVHIPEGRTMGRFGCEIVVEGGRVTKSSPFHID
jgi:hypothetical protein